MKPLNAEQATTTESISADFSIVVFCLQWDLVCDRAYLKDLTQTILLVGIMLGALICTILSDKFGRKPILLLCLSALGIVGVANAFASNYYIFIVLRFFTGVLCQVGIPQLFSCSGLFMLVNTEN